MALNRYLYPVKGTNIVDCVTLTTSVNITAAAGAVTTIVRGSGLTIVQSGAGVASIYTVTIDNSSSVTAIVGVAAEYGCAWDATKSIQFNVLSTSTTGCVLQAHIPNGAIAPVNVAGVLMVTLTCALSSVVA